MMRNYKYFLQLIIILGIFVCSVNPSFAESFDDITFQEKINEIEKSIVYIRGTNLDPNSLEEGGQATGFIIDSEGLILTNLHTLMYQVVQVQLDDKRIFPIQSVIHYDINKDYCVIKIDANNLQALPLGDSALVQTGDYINVIGNPTGERNTILSGSISGIWKSASNTNFLFDQRLTHGFSGGPAFNEIGEVVGLLRAGNSDQGLILPIDEIKGYQYFRNEINWYDFIQIEKLASVNYSNIAGTFGEMASYDEAILYYKKALEIDPNLIRTYLGLGTVYLMNDDVDEGIATLQKLVQIDRRSYEGLEMLALAYQLKNDMKQARYYAKKAVEICPCDDLMFDIIKRTD